MPIIRNKEIARLAGVSPSTVSNVLNGHKNVSAETREKILKLCKKYGYTPNILGRNLRIGKTNTIVFNFSDFDRGFYLKIIEGINDFLSKNGYELIICTNKSSRSFMNPTFTKGAISLDSKMTNDSLVSSAGNEYPIVVMDRMIENPYIKSVIADNYNIMRQLVQRIIDKDFCHFGFIGGLDHTLDNQERYQGFLDALAENNIDFDTKNYYHGDFREKSGSRAAKIMLLSNSVPEVVICANDNMAIGAMRVFEEAGLQVPHDVAITGFDNCELAEIKGLTTVEIPRYESGFLAAKCLVGMIEGETSNEPFKIKTSIIWRNTV